MQCSRCRTENEDAAKFCAACGASLHEVSVATANTCPVCRHANAPDANFCVACGTTLHQRAAPQAAQPKAVPPIDPVTASKGAAKPTEVKTATASGSPSSAEAASKPQLPPRPRVPELDFMQADAPKLRPEKTSRFELAAGLAVVILFLGGGGLWLNNQQNARVAEMVLYAAAPTKLAKATQESTPASGMPAPLPATPEADQQDAAMAPAAVESRPGNQAVSKGTSEQSRRPVKRKVVRRHANQPEPAPVVGLSEAERASAVAPTPPAPVERRRPSNREQVFACRQLSLFEGEKCLWRICNGKWGKDGCPSYER